MTHRSGAVAAAIAAIVVILTAAPMAAEAAWQHPVDAAVVDPFRPPTSRFGAGNRGLEYGTAGGESVHAVDAGRVIFAGAVGGRRHVVVDHGDGLRSTYAYVASATVVRGQWVEPGRQVAVAGPGFHLTARLGDTYIDPMLLIAGAEIEVHLIPAAVAALPEAPWPDRVGTLDPTAAVFDAVGDLSLSSQLEALAGAAEAWTHADCTDDNVAIAAAGGGPPAEGRVLVEVGGLGSSSGGASIGDLDATALGYNADDVVSFSYAGGCTPNPFGLVADVDSLSAALPVSDYGPDDTFQSIDVSAERLADLVDAVALERPNVAIDLAAHSLGGVVARRALEILATRHPDGVPVSVAITIGSPHGGADLATAAVATAGSEGAERFLDPFLPSDGAVRDATSVLELAEAGGFDLPPPGVPPDGVRVVAVAGATDLIVPAEHAIWDGAVNVVVATGITDGFGVHGELPARPEVERELALAIAGLAPRCVGLLDVLTSAIGGRVVSSAEDVVTVAAGLARWLF